jgi:SAM-dependent methyltransferase
VKSRQPVLSFIKNRPQFTSLFLLLALTTLSFVIKPFFSSGLTVELATTYQLISIAVAAVLLSYWMGLPKWWCWINAVFPILVGIFQSFNWSSSIFLVGFLILALFYWSNFLTRVPYYPSSEVVWSEIADLLPSDQAVNVLEIGSGFGGFCLFIKKHKPDSTVVGVELSPIIWLYSRIRQLVLKIDCQFLRQDYRRMNFTKQDLIFAFLSPAAMPALYLQAKKQMKTGAILASYRFEIPCAKNESVEEIEISYGKTLYVWRQS